MQSRVPVSNTRSILDDGARVRELAREDFRSAAEISALPRIIADRLRAQR
jgi:hypothetical protein